MRRIVAVLVLLMTVSLVSLTGSVPTACADELDSNYIPGCTDKWSDLEMETTGASDGEATSGDPDSLGDGHSRTLGNTDPEQSGAGIDGLNGTSLDEFLLYMLSQIQLLAL